MNGKLGMRMVVAAAAMAGLIGFAGVAVADGYWEYVLEFGEGGGDTAVDSNHNVYVLSPGRRCQVFTPDGQFLREKTGFDDPKGIAIDANDNIYVLDRRCLVLKYDRDFELLGGWDHCLGQGDLLAGRGIDVRDGIAYIATGGGVLRFSTEGVPLTHILDPGWMDVFALADGSVWCVNNNDYIGLVRHYSAEGAVLAEWTTILPDEDHSIPRGLAVDSHGRVFVADEGARVKIFLPDGTLDDLIQWQLCFFYVVELDGDDTLYVGTGFPDNVMKFRYVPLAVDPSTWGRVKARYR